MHFSGSIPPFLNISWVERTGPGHLGFPKVCIALPFLISDHKMCARMTVVWTDTKGPLDCSLKYAEQLTRCRYRLRIGQQLTLLMFSLTTNAILPLSWMRRNRMPETSIETVPSFFDAQRCHQFSGSLGKLTFKSRIALNCFTPLGTNQIGLACDGKPQRRSKNPGCRARRISPRFAKPANWRPFLISDQWSGGILNLLMKLFSKLIK